MTIRFLEKEKCYRNQKDKEKKVIIEKEIA